MNILVEYLSESMFYLTGGSLLVESWYFGVFILTLSVLAMVGTIAPFMVIINRPFRFISNLFSVFWLLAILYIVIGVSISQEDSMMECREEIVQTVTEYTLQPITYVVKACREKENYYGDEYGPWELRHLVH